MGDGHKYVMPGWHGEMREVWMDITKLLHFHFTVLKYVIT